MYTYILPFSSTEAPLPRAGGKGANLAQLVDAGFSVPPGFILSTDAYRAFVKANQLQPRIMTLVGGISPDDVPAIESVSVEICSLFDQGVMPAEIGAEIISAYHALTNSQKGVAVRSSATTEDLPGMAFAGQQDTYLNVIGEQGLLNAIQHCWSSLWAARAMVYRARNHIPPGEAVLAVIVQKQIASEVSGVAFTANPVTGRRSEIVINASFGLGEAVVSGWVVPDRSTVDPYLWEITERKIGSKEMAVIPLPGGGTHRVPGVANQEQSLQEAQILELARLAQAVAVHFGTPQDIEWAWADRQFYLLQSRHITALYPLPENDRQPEELRVYVNFNAIQGVNVGFVQIEA
jgi:pyruvate,water dikinase